jgi:hypothetical protein
VVVHFFSLIYRKDLPPSGFPHPLNDGHTGPTSEPIISFQLTFEQNSTISVRLF